MTCPQKQIFAEKTVLKKLYFFSVILGPWAKKSELWQTEHLLICQICILRVQQKKLREKTREFYTVFTTSWPSTNKFLDIRKKSSAFLKKLPFPSSEEFFAGNYFLEKIILFYHNLLVFSIKLSNCQRKLFIKFVYPAFYVSRGKFCGKKFFVESFILPKLSAFELKMFANWPPKFQQWF